jgi:hypothetical protein
MGSWDHELMNVLTYMRRALARGVHGLMEFMDSWTHE